MQAEKSFNLIMITYFRRYDH